MRRFLLTLATAASVLAVTSCSDATGIGSNPAGSYELQTINGQSLPVQLGSRTYEGGVLELDSNGEFVERLQFRDFGDPLSTQQDFFGIWERNGSEIRLDYDDGTTYFATRTSSSRIVVEDNSGNNWSYRRF
jgi:hypothetical protein